jgi:sec-independent protein translocase protein TatA
MMGLRMPELLVIGFIVILLFGPGKIAGLGQGLGEGIRGFKKALAGEDEKPVEGPATTSAPSKQGPGDGSRA